MGLEVGFGSISVGGLAHGGFVGWLAVVVSIFGRFRWFWVRVFFVLLFYVALNTQCKIFVGSFSKVQTNIGKTIIFPEIIFIYKHFTVENNLHRNKWSLIFYRIYLL